MYYIVFVAFQHSSSNITLFSILQYMWWMELINLIPFIYFLNQHNYFLYQISFPLPPCGRQWKDHFNPRYDPFISTWKVVKYIAGFTAELVLNKQEQYTHILLVACFVKSWMATKNSSDQTWVNFLISTSWTEVITLCMFLC